MPISDYAHYYKSNIPSKDLLLVFCALNTPEGKFLGSNIFPEDSRNILFLNSKADWYLNGIPGLGASTQETVAAIRSLIATEIGDLGTMVTFGGSMGGYGALLYGALLNATYSISFGAETFLSILGGISRPHVNNRKYNLKKIIANSKTQVRAFYGELFIPDILCALNISTLPNVKVQTIKNKDHALPAYFHRKYNLRNVVNSYFRGNDFCVDSEDAGSILNYPELIKFCFAANCCAIKKRVKPLLKITEITRKLLTSCHDKTVRSSVQYTLALCHEKTGDNRRAADHAAQANINAAHASTLNLYARCLHRVNDATFQTFAEKAVDAHVPGIFHDPVDSYRLLFNQYFQAKDYERAREIASKAVDAMPRVPSPFNWLIQIYNETDDHDNALETAKAAVAAHKSNATFYLHLGNIHFKRKEFREAESAFKRVIALAPKTCSAYAQLSHIYTIRNDATMAIRYITEAIHCDSTQVSYYIHLGNIHWSECNMEGAEAAYHKAITLDTHTPGPYIRLSQIFAQRNELEQAVAFARKAITANAHSAYCHNNLGNLLLALGDIDGAEAAQRRAISLDPENAEYRIKLSQVHVHRALGTAREGIALKNDFAPYYFYLEKLLQITSKSDEAAAARELARKFTG
ncbi:MAG: tetratricopeptide repeat protein [Desulfovibrionaceae bacterium]|nr:tetratricopeptide repeat protein [Desulfovibrionaceae bacterium]